MVTDNAPEQGFPIWSAGAMPVVAAATEVDIGNAAGLRGAIASASADHPVSVVDMSRTQSCDSSGLGVLVMAASRAREAGGELRVVQGGPAVRRIFRVTGVDRMFRLFDSLSEALAAGIADPPPAASMTVQPGPVALELPLVPFLAAGQALPRASRSSLDRGAFPRRAGIAGSG